MAQLDELFQLHVKIPPPGPLRRADLPSRGSQGLTASERRNRFRVNVFSRRNVCLASAPRCVANVDLTDTGADHVLSTTVSTTVVRLLMGTRSG